MDKKMNKKKGFTIALAAALIPTLVWCSLGWMLPDDITLVEGETTEISLQLPISAKTEESVGVLGLTTKPLADAFHLEMGSSIQAEPMEVGNTSVTFYLCDALPIKTVEARVIPKMELIPVGRTVGVTLDTKGLLVLGTGEVMLGGAETVQPSKGVLKTGDLLLEANGKKLMNKEAFQKIVKDSGGEEIDLKVERKGSQQVVQVTPVFSPSDQTYKIGAWVRDSIQGIGTVTYFNPQNDTFGALGHGVYDVDTGELMVIRNGSLIPSTLTEIVKGKKGQPGELAGTIARGDVLGEVRKNTEVGIYGKAKEETFQGKAVPVALKHEVKTGKATILSNIEGSQVKEYEIEIDGFGKGDTKDMMIRVTDEELLRKTGGIVQGMSGSPIIQDGQIVGAVTHVLVNDPQRGYGTFIETMLKEEQRAVV